MNNFLMEWGKNKCENWFHCKEKDTIDKLFEELFLTQTSALEAKKSFVSKAIYVLIMYQKDEELCDKLLLFNVKKQDENGATLPDDTDEKMKIIVSILCERKKNIKEKRRNIAAWSAIATSLLLGVTGVFLSLCSNAKLNDEQFQGIKQSIERSKPTDIRITNDTINVTKKQEAKK